MSIISRETIRARGEAAYKAGRTRDSHGMNPDALALADWLAGYDAAASSLASKIITDSFPLVHRNAPADTRLAQAQEHR